MPSRRASGGAWVRSSPPSTIRPDVGLITPAMVSSRVVFPEPAGPMTTPYPPCGMSNEMSESRKPPDCALTRCSEIMSAAERLAGAQRPQRCERHEREQHEHRGDWQRFAQSITRESIVAENAHDLRIVRQNHDRAEFTDRARPHDDRGGGETARGQRQ